MSLLSHAGAWTICVLQLPMAVRQQVPEDLLSGHIKATGRWMDWAELRQRSS